MKKLLAAILSGFLLLGCQAGLVPTVEPQGVSRDLRTEHGLLRIVLNWPEPAARSVQYVPRSSMRALFSVWSAKGEELAMRALSRTDAASTGASFELPPGTGYTVSVRFYDADGVLVGKGSSDRFSIERQQIVTVDLLVSAMIDTFAGTGVGDYGGDGGPARQARFYLPLGLAATRDGGILIADATNHVIRKVDADGFVSTIAGTGLRSTSAPPDFGDNGPAIETSLWSPADVSETAEGDLVIADTSGKGIRIVPAKSGKRYGQELTGGRLHTLYQSTLPGGTLISVTADAQGNLFVAERHQILMLPPEGEQIRVAGMGANDSGMGADGPAATSRLNLPAGLIVDPSGNVIFAERRNHRVRMLCRKPGTYFGLPMASGSVYTIAGIGNATSEAVPLGDGGDALFASFDTPRGLALDESGNLFIADSANQRIRILTPDRRIQTFAGQTAATAADGANLGDGGAALEATFDNPVGLAISGNVLYVTDSNNHRIRKLPL